MERTEQKKLLKKIWQIAIPLILGVAILYWTYRDFNFDSVWGILNGGMEYGWMLFSLVFGLTAQLCRGLRWKLTLEPLGERPKTANCIYAVFISYAANLVIPRIGEVSRCGVLSKYDGVSFAKSLGTVVTERIIDSICIALIAGTTLLLQAPVFRTFFKETGTNMAHFTMWFQSPVFYIAIVSLIAIGLLCYFLVRNVTIFARIRGILHQVYEGIVSLRGVRNIPLFVIYTIGIWTSFFLEFYVAFQCFEFSAHLSIMAALVMFVVGSIAVIVPTPNGAGPWHFAIITMMILYGVGKENASIFALLVHGIQTFLLILLGIYGLAALPFTNKSKTL